MIGSRGNWREIEKFLRDAPADKRPMAMDLLNVISAKDLRDTPASVLADHLTMPRLCKVPCLPNISSIRVWQTSS